MVGLAAARHGFIFYHPTRVCRNHNCIFLWFRLLSLASLVYDSYSISKATTCTDLWEAVFGQYQHMFAGQTQTLTKAEAHHERSNRTHETYIGNIRGCCHILRVSSDRDGRDQIHQYGVYCE